MSIAKSKVIESLKNIATNLGSKADLTAGKKINMRLTCPRLAFCVI